MPDERGPTASVETPVPDGGRAAVGPTCHAPRAGEKSAIKRRPWGPLAAVLLLVFVLIGLLAYGFRTDPRAIPSPLVGTRASDFALLLFDGGTVRLSEYGGKAVVLNFWASWCVPCREEAPLLEAAWRGLKDRDVVFLGVNIQDTEDAARAFVRDFRVTYPNGRDVAGKIAIDYGVYGIPETFFIDRHGRITAKVIGPLGPETLVARAREALQGVVGAEERRPGYQSVR